MADLHAPEAIAVRLQEAIGERPIREVAEAAGVDRITLRRLVHAECKRGPFLDTLSVIARALKVRPAWLAWGEGAMIEEGETDAA